MKTLATICFAIAFPALVTTGAAGAADIVLGDDVDDRVKVKVNKKSSNPAAHKIQYSAKSFDVVFTPGGGATDDPTLNGATAVVFSATDCQCITMAPAPTVSPGWTQSPATGTAKKYKWKDAITRSSAQVVNRKIKFKQKGGITYGLDLSPQGEVEVQITFGSAASTFCTRFTAPPLKNDTATTYKASIAKSSFAACSALPGICSCAPATTTTTTAAPTTTTSMTTTSSTTTTSTTTTTTTTSTTTTTLVCQFLTKWGSGGSGNGQFAEPWGVAVDATGNVYVGDLNNHRIQKFSDTGVFSTTWGSFGSGDGQFKGPHGLGVGSGNVYVPDTTNHRMQKFSDTGIFSTKWGSFGSADGQFNEPWDVAVDGSGNLYVADTSNHRIQKFSDTGIFSTKWGSFGSGDGQFNSPQGVAVDASGNVYVADTDNHRIQKFTDTGTPVTNWGTLGSGDGQFNSPHGVAVGSGNVYVADSSNNRIQKFTDTGGFLGKFGSSGSGNGQFSGPTGVALDASGNLYVADLSNQRIQKFSCP